MAINHTLVFFAPALAALTLVQLLDRPARLRLVLVFLAVLGILATVQGLGQLISGNEEMIRQYEEDPASLLAPLNIAPDTLQQFLFEHRLYSRGVRSFFTTRNSAGCFILISFFAALTLMTGKPKGCQNRQTQWLVRITQGGMALVFVVGLVLTRSKAAMLGLGTGLISWGLACRYGPWLTRYRIPIIAITLCLCIAVTVALGCYGMQHGRLPGGHSMLVRWHYWQAAARMIADHPWLGVGPGNFSAWYQHYKVPEALEVVADPHNVPLSILAQYGSTGLLSVMILLLGPLRRPAHKRTLTEQGPPRMVDCHYKADALIAGSALAIALLMLRPVFAPLPTSHDPAVILYTGVRVLLRSGRLHLLSIDRSEQYVPFANETSRGREPDHR